MTTYIKHYSDSLPTNNYQYQFELRYRSDISKWKIFLIWLHEDQVIGLIQSNGYGYYISSFAAPGDSETEDRLMGVTT